MKNLIFKIIVIGDVAVGKTSLCNRFTQNRFNNVHSSTMVVNFRTKLLLVGDEYIKLHLWDTAGTETFRSVTRSYYRGSVAALLVYDITRRETFSHVVRWLEDTYNHGNKNIKVLLVGNKSDLETQRCVSTEEGINFAVDNKIDFIETSAKEGNNVKMIEHGIRLNNIYETENQDREENIKKNSQKKCCY
ncbi:rab2a [Anaeramoeba flamelloides]|uniref:Rab2a n=1 Tax=Anaeramoeba flamelloides TaxID=1746091 RepID=A0ABQ8YJ03_9EUKA|nr:rab2a [Anaeramoeba flamelloides]